MRYACMYVLHVLVCGGGGEISLHANTYVREMTLTAAKIPQWGRPPSTTRGQQKA